MIQDHHPWLDHHNQHKNNKVPGTEIKESDIEPFEFKSAKGRNFLSSMAVISMDHWHAGSDVHASSGLILQWMKCSTKKQPSIEAHSCSFNQLQTEHSYLLWTSCSYRNLSYSMSSKIPMQQWLMHSSIGWSSWRRWDILEFCSWWVCAHNTKTLLEWGRRNKMTFGILFIAGSEWQDKFQCHHF